MSAEILEKTSNLQALLDQQLSLAQSQLAAARQLDKAQSHRSVLLAKGIVSGTEIDQADKDLLAARRDHQRASEALAALPAQINQAKAARRLELLGELKRMYAELVDDAQATMREFEAHELHSTTNAAYVAGRLAYALGQELATITGNLHLRGTFDRTAFGDRFNRPAMPTELPYASLLTEYRSLL